MNKTPYILPLLFLLLLGCEKVIDVDLNDVNPGFVIEANLSNSPFYAEVKLSKTANYFGESPIEKISGASVMVENESGESYIFDEVVEGIYMSNEIAPEEGVNYKLNVEYDGAIFESKSTLSPTVNIDSLQYFYDEGFAFLDPGYIVKVFFVDPINVENFYRIKIYENDTLKNGSDDFIVFNDRLIDGNYVEATLRGNKFEKGDTITVQLMSLDEGAYEYFKTFEEAINVNPGSAAPANPTSNISNGALGYFSAWSSDFKTVIIRDSQK